jgi:glycerophosphoryl diester phosphodiesterase
LTLVIAHRGSSAEEVENSLAAFRRAVREGADAIELDTHATADGEMVVLHDAVVGGQPIAAMPLGDVRRHLLPNGETIPTLSEALEAIGPGTIAFVEVKSLGANNEPRFLAALEAAPAPGNCHVHSFDHRIIDRLGKRLPRTRLGVLSCSYLVRPVTQLDDAGAGALWQEEWMIDRTLVEAVHWSDAKLYAWTVDNPSRLKALASLGVDGVCTNRPALARSVLG